RQSFLERLDYRNAPADAAFKADSNASVPRRLLDFGAMDGEQRLVGGNHMLASCNRVENQIFRGLVAADKLHDNVDIRVVNDLGWPVGQHAGRQAYTSLPSDIPNRDLSQFDGNSHAVTDQVGILAEDAQCAATDSSEANHPNRDSL